MALPGIGAHQLVAGVSRHPLEGRVDVDDPEFAIGDDDRLPGLLDRDREPHTLLVGRKPGQLGRSDSAGATGQQHVERRRGHDDEAPALADLDDLRRLARGQQVHDIAAAEDPGRADDQIRECDPTRLEIGPSVLSREP